MIDGTATLRGLTTGKGTSYRWEYHPTGLLDTPDIRWRDEPLPRRNGEVAGHDHLGGKMIGFEVVVLGSNRADCESKLTALRAAFAPGPTDERLDVRLSGTPAEYSFFGRPRGIRVALGKLFNGAVAAARCTFEATDSVAYGAEMVEVTGLATHNLPQTLPFILGYYDSDTVVNAGTASVDRWTVSMAAVGGSLVAPSIAHVGSGQIIFHDLTIPSGQSLTVDGRERRALLNGVTPVVPTIAQWWRIVPGSNTVRFAAGTGSSLSSTSTLTWRPGWS